MPADAPHTFLLEAYMGILDRATWRIRIDPANGPILWVFDGDGEPVEGVQPAFEEGGTWADLIPLVEW